MSTNTVPALNRETQWPTLVSRVEPGGTQGDRDELGCGPYGVALEMEITRLIMVIYVSIEHPNVFFCRYFLFVPVECYGNEMIITMPWSRECTRWNWPIIGYDTVITCRTSSKRRVYWYFHSSECTNLHRNPLHATHARVLGAPADGTFRMRAPVLMDMPLAFYRSCPTIMDQICRKEPLPSKSCKIGRKFGYRMAPLTILNLSVKCFYL